MDKSKNNKTKMTSEQLQAWMALRKKCHVHSSSREYSRKQKQKHKERNEDDS